MLSDMTGISWIQNLYIVALYAVAVYHLITTQEWSTSSQIRYQMDRARMVPPTREAGAFEILTWRRARKFSLFSLLFTEVSYWLTEKSVQNTTRSCISTSLHLWASAFEKHQWKNRHDKTITVSAGRLTHTDLNQKLIQLLSFSEFCNAQAQLKPA